MKWISTEEAAKRLGVHPATLRVNETPDGLWCYVYGVRIRVWRTKNGRLLRRRYSGQEVERLVWRLQHGP